LETIFNSVLSELRNKINSNLNSISDWLINHIPPKITKSVNDKLESLKLVVSNLFKQINENKSEIRESKSAMKGFTKQYSINGRDTMDAASFLSYVQPQVMSFLSTNRQTKINFVLTCTMERVDMKSGEVDSVDVPFLSMNEIILDSTNINEIYRNATEKITESIASFQLRGSNWRFKTVKQFNINTIIYKPLKGSSYVPLPTILANKKAIINMKNDDDQCFKWCITRALNPAEKDSERITKILRLQSEKINWDGIEFPVAADANIISRFERNNNISINVFGYESSVYPLYLSKRECDRCIDLLLIYDGNKKHFCWIKNFNRLMSLRTEKSHNSMYYCRRCLVGYRTVDSLNKHSEYCSQHNAQKIELPKPGTMLQFKNYQRSMRVPCIVYADFESFVTPIDTCQLNPNESYTNKYQKHTPSSFCYYIKCFDDNVYSQEPVIYTAQRDDDDIAQLFVNTLEDNIKRIYNKFKFKKRMIFTTMESENYNASTVCHI
jgi:hypothetical protein